MPGYGCEVHHINGWVKDDGLTDVDVAVLACGQHNRMAELGWTVVIERGKHIRLGHNQQLRIKTAYETQIR